MMVVNLEDLSEETPGVRNDTIRRILQFTGLGSEEYLWEVEGQEGTKHQYRNQDPKYKRSVGFAITTTTTPTTITITITPPPPPPPPPPPTPTASPAVCY